MKYFLVGLPLEYVLVPLGPSINRGDTPSI